jgi:hypothetical protein
MLQKKQRGRPRKDPVGWNALPVPPSLPDYAAEAASRAAQHVLQPVLRPDGPPPVASLAHHIPAHVGRLPIVFAQPAQAAARPVPIAMLPAQPPAPPMAFAMQPSPPASKLKLAQKLQLIAGELGANFDGLSVAGAIAAASAAIGEGWKPLGQTVAQHVDALMDELGIAPAAVAMQRSSLALPPPPLEAAADAPAPPPFAPLRCSHALPPPFAAVAAACTQRSSSLTHADVAPQRGAPRERAAAAQTPQRERSLGKHAHTSFFVPEL